MADTPLVYVGTRLVELGQELAQLSHQRDGIENRILAVLAEIRALGVPGAMVPSPNGTADSTGPRYPEVPHPPPQLQPTAPTVPVAQNLVKVIPWPQTPGARAMTLRAAERLVNRVLRAIADSPQPVCIQQIAVTVGESIPRVRESLRDLSRRSGRIEAVERGFWVANEHGRRHLASL